MPRYTNVDKLFKNIDKHLEREPVEKHLFHLIINEVGWERIAPVKHAHWIEGEDINCKPIVECSHCGDVLHLDGDSDPFHDHFYYCPNCGAKMDGEADNG